MNNKTIIALLVILIAAISFLAVQNFKLNKKVEELSTVKVEVKAVPETSETKPANPQEASPFDKPNVDPMANQFDKKSKGLTSILFEKKVHNFGRINEGEIVNTVFKFTNTGKLGLFITNAQTTCGCTVPNWPRTPIKPGESGEITVQFDSHDKKGEVDKTITVTANTQPAATVLLIKSTVVPKDK